MKKLGLIIKTLVFFSLCFCLATCVVDGTLTETSLFDEQYWGEWIRMDNGDAWYFASNYREVTKPNGNKESYTSLDDGGYYSKSRVMRKQSQNVIEVTEGTGAEATKFFLYASRVYNSTFKATAVSAEAGSLSILSRATGTPDNWEYSSKNNPKSKHEGKSNDGQLFGENIMVGEELIINIGGHEFEVTPQTDGDNVGTLTLRGGVNIKTSIVPQKDSPTDMMSLYIDNGKDHSGSYKLTINFTNVGQEVSSSLTYTLTMPEGITTTGKTKDIISSLAPGKTQGVDLTVYCDDITGEYEFKTIGIETVNYYGTITWSDSVSLRLNRESVTFNIWSQSKSNGVVIAPNGKTYYFNTTGSNGTTSVSVPKYSNTDYLVVFSGATVGTDTRYSFAVDRPASTDSTFTFDDVPSKYKFNESEEEAALIKYDDVVKAYLQNNVANYYKVRF